MQADRSAGEVKHACTFAQVPLARLAHPSALVTLGEPWQPAASVAIVAIEDRNVHRDCHRKPCRSSKVMALRWCTKRTIDKRASIEPLCMPTQGSQNTVAPCPGAPGR